MIAASSILLLGLMIIAARSQIIRLQIGSAFSGTDPNLIVSTQAENGALINGYWVVVKNSSASTAQTGFSKAKLTLPAGNYMVGVGGYGGEYFAYWEDGNLIRCYLVTIDGSASITLNAMYEYDSSESSNIVECNCRILQRFNYRATVLC